MLHRHKGIRPLRHKLVGALVAAALALAAPVGAGAPAGELLLPGRHLGGVELGMTRAQVLEAWGELHGVCRGCRHTTWYFNEEPFEPQGAGVVFERGRVAHVFTLWQPDGWRTGEGLALGAPAAEIARTFGPLDRRSCPGYYALLDEGGEAQTAYYVFDDELWGFGLTLPETSPCL